MTILYFVLLIGVLIFVHEMGHFLFAKLFDVKVLKFSLGFGPRAAGIRRGETDNVVAWVPLGGFVKMLGEDPHDEITPEDQGRAFNQKPLWQRYIIVLAGPAFNLIFPILIYFVFFAAQSTMLPAVVGKVFAGQPAAEAGLRPGDKVVAIDGKKVRYWDEMQSIISDSPGQSLRLTIEREGERLERYITPQEQISRSRLDLEERVGRIGISPAFELAQIGVSEQGSPAARAGLQTGDLITVINGRPIERWAEVERLLEQNRGESLSISFLRPGPPTSRFFDLRQLTPLTTVVDPEPLRAGGLVRFETGIHSAEFFVAEVEKGSPAAKIGMRPGDRVTRFDGRPLEYWEMIQLGLDARQKQSHTISWVPRGGGGGERTASFKLSLVTTRDEYMQDQQHYVFGIKNRILTRLADPIPIEGRFTFAVSKAVRKTGEVVGVMAIAFVQLFRGAIPRDTIGGPIMLYYTAGVAAEKGWDHFLWMMALISINLGILNLLPIPILDGGHIMFFSIEAIKRRPLSLRAREIASYVGLLLLISLMVFAFKNDIVRYWFK
jgi:regulator of sigma E protease